MPPFAPHYPPMIASMPAPTEPASDSSSSSQGSKRTRTDWTTEETSVLLEIWGALHETLKSAFYRAEKKYLGSNPENISKQVPQSGAVNKQDPRSDQEKNQTSGVRVPL